MAPRRASRARAARASRATDPPRHPAGRRKFDEAVPYFESLVAVAREKDATRPVSFVTCKVDDDRVARRSSGLVLYMPDGTDAKIYVLLKSGGDPAAWRRELCMLVHHEL